MAVAKQEGLSGRIGDGGHAYGPFQLNNAGGVITKSHPGTNDPRIQAWASSPQGIGWALDQIARVARGKTGAAAVNAIVRQFERPADPDGEVARALAGLGVGGTPAAGAPVPAGGLPRPENVRSPDPLLAGVLKSNGMPDLITNLLSTVAKPAATLDPPGAVNQPGGKVTFAAGADRAGAHTNPAVVQFASQIAALYGKPLTIGTGTNHNQHVAGTNRESAHWTGFAADLPATGSELIQIGRNALIAAGMPRKQAMKQTGGLFNVGGFQVIFNTQIGGDHTNHVHIGIRR